MKKVNYLLGAALSAGVLFTGCVNTEESDSVAAIRMAQASKISAEAADILADVDNQKLINDHKAVMDSLIQAKEMLDLAVDKENNALEILNAKYNLAAKQKAFDEMTAKIAADLLAVQKEAEIKAANAEADVIAKYYEAVADLKGAQRGLIDEKRKLQVFYNDTINKDVLVANAKKDKAELEADLVAAQTALTTLTAALENEESVPSILEGLNSDLEAAEIDVLKKEIAKNKAEDTYDKAFEALNDFYGEYNLQFGDVDMDNYDAIHTSPQGDTYAVIQGMIDELQAKVDVVEDEVEMINGDAKDQTLTLVTFDDKSETYMFKEDDEVDATIDGKLFKEDELTTLNDELVDLNDAMEAIDMEIADETDKLNKVLALDMQGKKAVYDTYNTDYLTKKTAFDTKNADYETKKRAAELALAKYTVDDSSANLTALTNANTARDNAYSLVNGVDGDEVPATENDYKIEMETAFAHVDETAGGNAFEDWDNAVDAYDAQVEKVDDLTNKIDDTDAIVSKAEKQVEIDEKQVEIDEKQAEIAELTELVTGYGTQKTTWEDKIASLTTLLTSTDGTTDALFTTFKEARTAYLAALTAYDVADEAKSDIEDLIATIEGTDGGEKVDGEYVSSLEAAIAAKETEIENLEEAIVNKEDQIVDLMNGTSSEASVEDSIAKQLLTIEEKEAEIKELETKVAAYQALLPEAAN